VIDGRPLRSLSQLQPLPQGEGWTS
jgi:hypothetical protein